MKLTKYLSFAAAALLSMGAVTSCSDDDKDLVYIEMSHRDITVTPEGVVEVAANVTDADGNPVDVPLEWTVDAPQYVNFYDPNFVAQKVDPVDPTNPDEEEGQTPEEGTETPENPDVETQALTPEQTPALDPKVYGTPAEDNKWTSTMHLKSGHRVRLHILQGSQDQTIKLKATMPSGQFGIVTIRVARSEFASNSITPLQSFKRSYQRQPNDTVWFKISPFQLVHDYAISYSVETTEVLLDALDPADAQFTFPTDAVVVDDKNERVGVVYTAPRICGKANLTLTLGDEENSTSATQQIYVYPKLSCGFEVNGKRPLAQEPNPSNIKLTLLTANMDVCSSYDVGVCVGVEGGWQQDILNAKNYFDWSVEGSAVVVEDQYIDNDYASGYVAYLKVRSGISEGLSVITFTLPDTTLVCNLSVINYNTSYPVERIVTGIADSEGNISEQDHFDVTINTPFTLNVSVKPDVSFEFHIPEVTLEDPTMLELTPRDDNSATSRTIKGLKLGDTRMHIRSLEQEKWVTVTVHDAVSTVNIANGYAPELLVGEETELNATVVMMSGATTKEGITFEVSNPEVAQLTDLGNGRVKFTGLAAGTTTVVAKAGGLQSVPVTIKVKGIEDKTINNAELSNAVLADYGDGTYAVFLEGEDSGLNFSFEFEASSAIGSHDGSGLTAKLNNKEYAGCEYHFAVAQNGDGFILTGYVQLPNGMKIIFNSLNLELEE